MQFNHPEILVLLFLLIIPLLIHLFQLQRFRKEAFTNVKFLQEIQLESRKSSRLKKFLILATRLLALACLIFAFAQPVIKSSQEENTFKTVVYIDNSLSMQAKDENGAELMQSLKAGLIDGFEGRSADFSLITNSRILNGLDLDGFKQEVLDIKYHPIRKEISQVLLEAQTVTRKDDYEAAKVFLFSDFRRPLVSKDSLAYQESNKYYLIPVRSERSENLVLDSLWIASADRKNTNLMARITAQNVSQENLSVSLVINGELFGKTSQSVESGQSALVEFSIPSNISGSGAMTFTDPRLGFDNSLFFTLPPKVDPKVLIIGERSEYLSRIYDPESFEVRFSAVEDLDQGSINDFDLVLINELPSISPPLAQSLRAFVEDLGNLVIIPPRDPDMFSYQQMIAAFGIGRISGEFEGNKLITTVNYEHPFFQSVFKSEVTNFDYPHVNSGLETRFNASSTLLGFQDGTAFIQEIPYGANTIYWISSSLGAENSDFKDSPLIVPVFFNFSLPENVATGLYSLIGRRNELQVEKDSPGENALKLTYGEEEYIPLQKSTSRKVTLITKEYPLKPGTYQVRDQDLVLAEHAFNYDRDLIRTDYQDLEESVPVNDNVRVLAAYTGGIEELNSLFSSRSLWQLFTIFALSFLILEMLIHKFFKT